MTVSRARKDGWRDVLPHVERSSDCQAHHSKSKSNRWPRSKGLASETVYQSAAHFQHPMCLDIRYICPIYIVMSMIRPIRTVLVVHYPLLFTLEPVCLHADINTGVPYATDWYGLLSQDSDITFMKRHMYISSVTAGQRAHH